MDIHKKALEDTEYERNHNAGTAEPDLLRRSRCIKNDLLIAQEVGFVK